MNKMKYSSRRKIGAISFTVAMMLMACSDESIDQNKYIGEAKRRIELKLSDPSSAQYKNLYTNDTGIVCGQVNAKNLLGGYVGFVSVAVDGDEVIINRDRYDYIRNCKGLREKWIGEFEQWESLQKKHESACAINKVKDSCDSVKYYAEEAAKSLNEIKTNLPDHEAKCNNKKNEFRSAYCRYVDIAKKYLIERVN